MKLAVFVSLLVIIPFQAVAGSCVGKNMEIVVEDGHDIPGDGTLETQSPMFSVKKRLKMKLAVFVSLLVIIPIQTVAGSCVGKTVDVWVANGHGLTGDGLQDPDPYVVVSIGGETKKTRVIHSNSNPSWWKKFQFHDAPSDLMRIDVWEADSGLRGDDDHLGTCVEPLNSGGRGYHVVQCTVKDDGFVKVFYKCH